MASAARRLHLVRYEADRDWDRDLDRDEERALDDREVERLLLGRSERAQPTHPGPDSGPATATGTAGEPDSLVGMRGLFIGLACATSIWSLIAAIFLLG